MIEEIQASQMPRVGTWAMRCDRVYAWVAGKAVAASSEDEMIDYAVMIAERDGLSYGHPATLSAVIYPAGGRGSDRHYDAENTGSVWRDHWGTLGMVLLRREKRN